MPKPEDEHQGINKLNERRKKSKYMDKGVKWLQALRQMGIGEQQGMERFRPYGQSASGIGLSVWLGDLDRLFLVVAERDLERDLETLRALGRDTDREWERERERLTDLRTGVLDRRTGVLDLRTGLLDLERAGDPDLLLRFEYDGDLLRRSRSLLRLRER